MAEWIGRLISDWPFWAVLLTACVAGVIWVITQSVWYGPLEKKEWWQDREKRLNQAAATKQAKTKVKKG